MRGGGFPSVGGWRYNSGRGVSRSVMLRASSDDLVAHCNIRPEGGTVDWCGVRDGLGLLGLLLCVVVRLGGPLLLLRLLGGG